MRTNNRASNENRTRDFSVRVTLKPYSLLTLYYSEKSDGEQ